MFLWYSAGTLRLDTLLDIGTSSSSGRLKERSRQVRWDRITPTGILLIMQIVKAQYLFSTVQVLRG